MGGVEWNNQGLVIDSIAVNLSGQQINDKQLVSKVQKILQLTDCPPQRLELEVTEGFVMHDMENSAHYLKDIHDLGIKISIEILGPAIHHLAT